MKKFLVGLVALAMVTVGAAATAMAAVEVEGDAYVGFYDKYLWRGFDLSGSEGVVQGGVDISHKGFTVSYWTNMQASDDKAEGFKSGEATETDITLDYSFDLNDTVSVSVGNIYYNLDGLNDTNEAYVSVGLNTLLSPALTVYYDWDEAELDGLFATASVGHTIEVGEKVGINLGALVSYNQASEYAVGEYREFHNYELSLGLDYAVTDNITISPSYMLSSGLSAQAKEAIDTETLAGISVTFAF